MMAKLSRGVIQTIATVSSRAFVGLFRFATTDHTGATQRLANMPKMGFLASLTYILWQFVMAVLGALVVGVLVFLLIAYVIPFMLELFL